MAVQIPSSSVVRKVANYLGFQVGWMACIGGAASGWPLLGPLVMGSLLAAHIVFAGSWRREATLVLSAAALGYVADSTLVLSGVLSFPGSAGAGWPCPVWIVALWMGLAGTLHESMGWLKGRYVLSAAFGAVSAPIAYAAGVRAGAASFGLTSTSALIIVAVEWTLAMPVLLRLAALTAPDGRRAVADIPLGPTDREVSS